ncbi:Uncharacterised protein [Bordetella pertussis]|nr:Uncharacterised protein [Bordetella pertussis]
MTLAWPDSRSSRSTAVAHLAPATPSISVFDPGSVPPTRLFSSTSSTRRPAWQADRAAASPAGPAPTTSTSQ